MNRTLVTAILGIASAVGLMVGLGWGLPADGGAYFVPPILAAGMLALGLVLIGAGFYRRN